MGSCSPGEFGVYRRQSLTYKDDPGAKRFNPVKTGAMSSDLTNKKSSRFLYKVQPFDLGAIKYSTTSGILV